MSSPSQFGKNIIDTLTTGMYTDPLIIYREYVQNAVDSIDATVKAKIFKARKEGQITIDINSDKRSIVIEDNGAGIETSAFRSALGDIAKSTKDRYKNRGFRGIGRLGGVGYCDKLIFESSSPGSRKKNVMVWDAKRCREIMRSSANIPAIELVSIITDFSADEEEKDKHYFRVILDRVTDTSLLDHEKVANYLKMVAPLPFSDEFTFKDKILAEAKKEGVRIDAYNVRLGSVDLYKGYKNSIQTTAGKTIENVVSVEFFQDYYNETDLLYWGWYAVTGKMRQLKDEVNERNLRLRKANIQIGSEKTLDEFYFKADGKKYFIGEVHAVHRDLVPNARRDFFEEHEVFTYFKQSIQELFKEELHNLFYAYANRNIAFRKIDQYHRLEQQIKDNQDQGRDYDNKDLIEQLNSLKPVYQEQSSILIELTEQYKGKPLEKTIVERIPEKTLLKASNLKIRPLSTADEEYLESIESLEAVEKKIITQIFRIIKSSESTAVSNRLIKKIKEFYKNR